MTEREIDERIRGLYPEAEPAGAADREQARQALESAIADATAAPESSRRRLGGRRLLIPATAALAAVGATVVLILAGGPTGEVQEVSAAQVLRDAADAERELAPPLPRPGEYLYVKSENEYISAYMTVPGAPAPPPGSDRKPPSSVEGDPITPVIDYAYLEPEVREVWIGERGGRLETHFGEPIFITEEDREAWKADGRPGAVGVSGTDRLGKTPPLDIPSDPDVLLEQMRAEVGRYIGGPALAGSPMEGVDAETQIEAEVFDEVGSLLGERSATPSQRAALLQVASRLNGIELVGEVTDPAGRPGVAVAIDNPMTNTRNTLVFDSETSALLAKEDVINSEDNDFGWPVGTVVGHATYLERAIVDEAGQRP